LSGALLWVGSLNPQQNTVKEILVRIAVGEMNDDPVCTDDHPSADLQHFGPDGVALDVCQFGTTKA